jgi:hypothetical protein
MSALDEAIAAHAAHGAGACADPLTDSFTEQFSTAPARFSDLPAGVYVRPGWEHEVAEPRVHRGLAALVLATTLLVCALLGGCGGGDEPCREDFVGPPAPGFEDLPVCEDPGRARIPSPACVADPRRCA